MKLSRILCSAAAALAALAACAQAQQRTSHYLPTFPHVAPAHLHHGKHAPVYTYEPVYDAVPGPKVVDVVGHDGYPFPPVSGHTHRCGVMGGVSWYFLRPHITNNDAFIVTSGIGTASPQRDAPDFAWDFHTAYGAWAGWTFHNGIGVRGSFFRFDQDSETLSRTLPSTVAGTTIVPPGQLGNVAGVPVSVPGALGALGLGTDQLTFDSGLELLTIDLEFTWDWRWNRFSMLVSAGGRYIDMEQSYRANFRNATDIAAVVITEQNQLSFINSFQGGGPTVAWFGRYQFAKCHLAVFGSFRAALLVGSSERETSFLRSIVDPVGVLGGNQNINPREVNNDDHTLPVLEAEVGLEWGFDLHYTRWFIRGSAVNQTYFNAGNAAGTVGDLSLFGGRVSVGVNY